MPAPTPRASITRGAEARSRLQLEPELGFWDCRDVRVRKSVIADRVPRIKFALEQVGIVVGIHPGDKKSGGCSVFFQDEQQGRG